MTELTRRQFLSRAAAATAAAGAFTILPRHVLGGPNHKPPSEKLNVGGVGIGGMGKVDLKNLESENIVALCDVDEAHAAEAFARYPDARRYKDFRVMLEKEPSLDAVVIATPDHLHAVVTMAAIRAGKHVYCEKPLTHTVHEARAVLAAAREAGVATQMGNMGRSGEAIRLVREWIQDGAIGPVEEVQCFTPMPVGIWPQGMERPTDAPPVPATLDWDLWLGPAPERPYHPAYCPFKWRGWWDFGTGSLGDQACHLLDVPFWALDLDAPERIEASCTPHNGDSYPQGSIVRYWFPARGSRLPVRVIWHDGGLMPARPAEMDPTWRLGNQYGGAIFIGAKGKLVCGTFGEGPRLLPESLMESYQRPPKTIPRSEGHYAEWVSACKGGSVVPGSNFEYAAPLTEVALLGNIALRLGRPLEWDAAAGKFRNDAEADGLLHREYREGWVL